MNNSFILPVDRNFKISSFYGKREDPISKSCSMHYGIDFACPEYSNIYATADGIVIWVGYNETYGNTIIIEHSGSYLTLYAHLNKIIVKNNDNIYQGQTIGYSGATGLRVTGPHLHFETIDGNILYNNKPIKDIIQNNNGIIGTDGYNHIGIAGNIGRYNMFNGKLLNNENQDDDRQFDRTIKERDMSYINPQIYFNKDLTKTDDIIDLINNSTNFISSS